MEKVKIPNENASVCWEKNVNVKELLQKNKLFALRFLACSP